MPTRIASNQLSASFGASPRPFTVAAPTSGNAFLIAFRIAAGSTGLSVTDDQGGTYSIDYNNTDQGGAIIAFASRRNITNAPTEISIGWTNGDSRTVEGYCYEYSGIAASSHVGETGTFGTSFSETPAWTPTTTTDNEVAIASLTLDDGRDLTTTGLTKSPTGEVTIAWLSSNTDLGAAGAKSVGGTLTLSSVTTGANARIVGITYRASGGGGASIPRLSFGLRQQLNN